MPFFRAADLAAWSNGQWKNSEPAGIRGVSTDTRSLKPDSLYVALRGPRFNGHDFVAQAFERGAAAALVTANFAETGPQLHPLLCVPDTWQALGLIARGYRASLSTTLMAVTGSVGKTTVKEMLADMLSAAGPTSRTHGNWNNDVGLPLSLLDVEPENRFGVFELGMNHKGELAQLCAILKPSVGVITNVGPVHLEFFDSVRDIAMEKAIVFRCLPADGLAVLSRDDEWYEELIRSAPCPVVTTSLRKPADYSAHRIDKEQRRFTVKEAGSAEQVEMTLSLPGEHMIRNALLAVAVARRMKVPWPDIQSALGNYVPLPMRWNRLQVKGVEIINDAYNANPMSMRAALDTFARMAIAGRKWLVLGGMLELGVAEKSEHANIGTKIAGQKWAGLITVGRLGAYIADGAESEGFPADKIVRCPDHQAAARVLAERVKAGDILLLKASRGEKIEEVFKEWVKMK